MTEPKRVVVEIPSDLRKKLKVRAAQADMSVKSLVKLALIMYLEATKKSA